MPIFLIALGQAVADTAPGFVWRLQTEDGNATAVHAFDAFTLKEHYPPPDATGSGPIRSPEEWTCPA